MARDERVSFEPAPVSKVARKLLSWKRLSWKLRVELLWTREVLWTMLTTKMPAKMTKLLAQEVHFFHRERSLGGKEPAAHCRESLALSVHILRRRVSEISRTRILREVFPSLSVHDPAHRICAVHVICTVHDLICAVHDLICPVHEAVVLAIQSIGRMVRRIVHERRIVAETFSMTVRISVGQSSPVVRVCIRKMRNCIRLKSRFA